MKGDNDMGAPRVTLEAFIERSNAIHNGKYDYSKVEWVNTRVKVEIVCPVHGSFFQKPFKHLEGQGCPDCRKNADVTQEEFVARAKRLHGDGTYDYSRVQYKHMWEPVEIICPVHGSFFQMPAKHVKEGKEAAQGCPKCRYTRQRRTNQERYGVDNPMQNSKFVDMNWNAKVKNGTCSTSPMEERMYRELVDVFGEQNVKRNYKENRYPFYCDFYIVSHDLFIELNATWFHGPHAFDKDAPDDLKLLELWKSKSNGSRSSYGTAIRKWTVTDPLRMQTAKRNGLNYLVFWDIDLSDFHAWLKDYKNAE